MGETYFHICYNTYSNEYLIHTNHIPNAFDIKCPVLQLLNLNN